jgi:Skp family chaperone for outer membrane proteins
MRVGAVLAVTLATFCPVHAQETVSPDAVAPLPDVPSSPVPASADRPLVSPVLTLDQDRLFSASAWGKRAEAAVQAASVALSTENRRIEADLAAEEKSLTDKRVSMTPEAFRAEADAFDARVVAIRKAQDAKAREIGSSRDAERQAFFGAVLPTMAEVMKARGAVAILDARAIFVSVNAIDVTDEMIARIDATIGAGKPPVAAPLPPPATPEPAPSSQSVPSP